ncbi:hypothetical protein [Candidatus Nitrosocosmicus sp. SS]|jgi:hypothetical protein|uniref:hypothetical protein n=1 Tax=Candidatus Nitrosocosmicus agrestis TaxID=2563600 RepID=UPI00122E0872|nr:hypothetical protein [Candidatus Nitrosocosmicus sp. SS]KAA2283378.1 hypothetical protein F1Z66_02475 [Candidatus Nitrosocosmicus sp. SS]KAF0868976.1 hypothetical protein E5N71_08255 [Candidatus Nitrosocosmicus sp. SS]
MSIKKSFDELFEGLTIEASSPDNELINHDIEYIPPSVILWLPIPRSSLDIIFSVDITNRFDTIIETRRHGIIKSRIQYKDKNGEIEIDWSILEREIDSQIKDRTSEEARLIKQTLFSILYSNEDRMRIFINGISNNYALDSIKEFLKNEYDSNGPHVLEPGITKQSMTLKSNSITNTGSKLSKSDVNSYSENVFNGEDLDKQVIFEKIAGKNLVEYVNKIAKKTIKQEHSLVNLLLYTGLSTYTKNPLNLGIIAPTSEGKTYPVTEMTKFLPTKDVWMIGSMSPKVIIRDRGILVDENNKPIEQKVQDLTEQLKKSQKNSNKDEESNLTQQLKEIHKNSKVLIDLSGKVLVFLEPPHKETWDILKPILSHYTYEIEHPYVYKTETKGMEVKHIVTRGWPACIFCSAKDESNWPMWPEIQSRFLITPPNMIKQKYLESTILIGQRSGLPSLVQEQLIVSQDETQIAKDCISIIKDELLASYENGVWIPYQKILTHSLPSEKGTDVRIANRIFSLLNIVTKSNSFNRFKLKFGNEIMSISSLEDLREVLKLTQNITGIPSYKLDFFREVFVPLFQSKEGPEEKEDGTTREDRVAVYTNELADSFKE